MFAEVVPLAMNSLALLANDRPVGETERGELRQMLIDLATNTIEIDERLCEGGVVIEGITWPETAPSR